MRVLMCAVILCVAAPLAVAQEKAAKAPATPMAAAGETVKVSAKVTAIDQAKRLVTLQSADGQEVVVKVGEEARNLAQVKVGDVVNAEYRLAAVVSLRKGSGMRSATEKTTTERAKLGEMPSGTITKEGTITGDVIAVDAAKGTVSVKGPGGRVVQGKVADKALLKDVKVGDQVDLDYSASVALQVVPGTAPAKK